MGTLIAFNVMLLVIFVLFWLPYVSRLTKNTSKTRMMLTIIPLEIIQNTYSMKKFIKKYIKDH